MIRVGFWRMVFASLLWVSLSGCFSSGSSQLDEEKEPHFMLGKSRETAMDYEGAIEAFEKAAEVNPQSASAHLELGLLYERNDTDDAAAIYHFQKFLKLRPNSDNAEVIKQHILGCKQVLARAISLGPISQSQQRELEKLAEENKMLRDEVERWRAYYKDHSVLPPTTANLSSNAVAPVSSNDSTSAPHENAVEAPRSPSSANTPTQAARSYKVQSGDTMSSIARKHSVKLEALMSANPGVEPKKLRVGQMLNVPPT